MVADPALAVRSVRGRLNRRRPIPLLLLLWEVFILATVSKGSRHPGMRAPKVQRGRTRRHEQQKPRRCPLIIDDKPANQLVLNAVLEPDFELLFADSGPLGLARAVEVLPDLILLNLMMAEPTLTRPAGGSTPTGDCGAFPVVFAMEQSEPRAAASSGLPWNVADGLTQPIKAEITRGRIRNLLHREHLRRAKPTANNSQSDDKRCRRVKHSRTPS